MNANDSGFKVLTKQTFWQSLKDGIQEPTQFSNEKLLKDTLLKAL